MSVIISRRDLIEVAPEGAGRVYTIAPLTFRERAAMKADLVREAGQPVFREQLLAARRAALQELAPENLAKLLAVLDEAETLTDPATPEALALTSQVAVIDAAAMEVPAYAALVARNYHTVYFTPLVAARFGLRDWRGDGLPPFRRMRNQVPDELLDAVPVLELEEVGWAVWNAAHVSGTEEKN
jgi:hypothetical protein